MSAAENKAVFLSYASQDAEAARRICDSLRSGGVEVWFDADGGLEHGDEWDQKIRRQIKECVLFIPVISANTQAREEGYFRIEWELAAQRALGIASGVAFILPIVIDDTREPDALVPDRFRAVQWTRLRGGEVPAEVQRRFLKLWSHRTGVLRNNEAMGTGAAQETRVPASARDAVGKPGARHYAFVAAAMLALIAGAGWWLLGRKSPALPPPSAATTAVKPAPAAAPLSEARQLLAKTGVLMDALDNSRDDFKLAEDLIAQAKARDSMDAEVWATEAQLHERYLIRGWDVSDTRREAARAAAQRALRLDPRSFEARFAQAGLLGETGRDGAEKERQLRELRTERPVDQRVLRMLAVVIDRLGRMDESAAIADESAALPGGDPLALYNKSLGFWFAGRTVEAETAIQASLAQQPFTGALMMAMWYRIALHGDLDGARSFVARIEPGQLIEDRAAFFAFYLEFLAHRPDAAIARLQAVPRDWLNDFWYRGPKGWLVGDALDLGGRHDAAVIEWTAALKLVEQRLATSPSNASLIYNRTSLLIRLGQREEAERQFAVLLQMNVNVDISSSGVFAKCHALLGHKVEALKAIAAGLAGRSHAVIFPSGALRLDPVYDSLRGEPEFAKLIAEAEALERTTPAAAPKSNLTTTAPAKADDKSVAVLAFANLSDDKGNEYFSDGISEELINALGKVPGLKVPARTSSFYFKGKNVPVPEIAQQLGVAYVIEGSVQRAGEKVKISARLSKAADGFQVWTDSFLRDAKDVFAVEEEIAGLIAKQLSLKLGASSAASTASVNPQALSLLLEARYYWNQRGEQNFDRAEALLNRALAIDPAFARAYSALADVWLMRASYRLLDGGADVTTELKNLSASATRASELDPTLVDPVAARGYGLMFENRMEEAGKLFADALGRSPDNPTFLYWRGLYFMNQGDFHAARRDYEKSRSFDPMAFIVWHNSGECALALGNYDEAAAFDARANELRKGGFVQSVAGEAMALWLAGRHDEAVALARSTRQPELQQLPWVKAGYAIWVLRQAGLEAEAAKYGAEELPTLPAHSYQRGFLLAGLGRFAEALPYLEKMPPYIYYSMASSPIFEPWREDPQFKALVEKLHWSIPYAKARATRLEVLRR